ncbi:MAG: hypothetical protein II011_05575 [Prevotella sp.]|nr:hypothetical protein [Prevotella sp.]
MEYLNTILNIVFGGVGVGGLITAIYYRKANKAIKEEEAKKAASETKQSESAADQADIETQMKKIELGNKYMEDTLKMVELVKTALDRSDGNQEVMMSQLNIVMDLIHKLSDQTDKQEKLLQLIVEYLNGNFQEYVESLKQQGLLDENFTTRKQDGTEDQE